MKKYANEFKVGLFVIVCLAGLAYLVLSTGKITFGKKGYNIYVVFNEVAGLDEKAPVMLNGLEVGKVDDIRFSYDENETLIVLKLWLRHDVKVREDSEISIKTLGLMGEKYIQISSSKNSGFIKPETSIYGKPYADLDTLVASANMTMDENKERIAAIAKSMEATAKNFESFSDDIRRHPWKLLRKSKENK